MDATLYLDPGNGRIYLEVRESEVEIEGGVCSDGNEITLAGNIEAGNFRIRFIESDEYGLGFGTWNGTEMESIPSTAYRVTDDSVHAEAH